MSTSSINGTTGPSSSSSSGSSGSTSSSSAIPANLNISETGFLQLITSQMQNQNPLQPADPTQFLAQIEGLSEVSSLQSMQTSMQSNQLTSSASLLGQSVLAPTTTATLASGGSVSGAVTAPSGASSLTVTMSNSSGQVVDSFQVNPASSGLTKFSWNGATSGGGTAAAGQYTVAVTANVGGTTQIVSPMVSSQVQSVTLDSAANAVNLNTNNGTVPLSSVVTIE